MTTTTAQPVRLMRSRRKGDRLVSPNGLSVVCVTRPGKWGNPFRVFGADEYLYCDASHRRKILTPWVIFDHDQDVASTPATRQMAVEHFRIWLTGAFDAASKVRPCPFTANDIRRELRGKNLACYCPPGAACHADVLLEIANAK